MIAVSFIPFMHFACNIVLYFDYLGRSSRSFSYDEKSIIEYNTQSSYPKCPTTKKRIFINPVIRGIQILLNLNLFIYKVIKIKSLVNNVLLRLNTALGKKNEMLWEKSRRWSSKWKSNVMARRKKTWVFVFWVLHYGMWIYSYCIS